MANFSDRIMTITSKGNVDARIDLGGGATFALFDPVAGEDTTTTFTGSAATTKLPGKVGTNVDKAWKGWASNQNGYSAPGLVMRFPAYVSGRSITVGGTFAPYTIGGLIVEEGASSGNTYCAFDEPKNNSSRLTELGDKRGNGGVPTFFVLKDNFKIYRGNNGTYGAVDIYGDITFDIADGKWFDCNTSFPNAAITVKPGAIFRMVGEGTFNVSTLNATGEVTLDYSKQSPSTTFITGNLTINDSTGLILPDTLAENAPFALCSRTLSGATSGLRVITVGGKTDSANLTFEGNTVKYVWSGAPTKATATLDENFYDFWSEIKWDGGIKPSATLPAEITVNNNASITMNGEVVAKSITFKGTGVVGVSDNTIGGAPTYNVGKIVSEIPIVLGTESSFDVDAGTNDLTYEYSGTGTITPTLTCTGALTIGGGRDGTVKPTLTADYTSFTVSSGTVIYKSTTNQLKKQITVRKGATWIWGTDTNAGGDSGDVNTGMVLDIYGKAVLNGRFSFHGTGTTVNLYAGGEIAANRIDSNYGNLDMYGANGTIHVFADPTGASTVATISAPWRLRTYQMTANTIDIPAGVMVDVTGALGTTGTETSAGVTKIGAGTLKFSGTTPKKCAGAITISNGSLIVEACPGSCPVTMAAGTTLDLSSNTGADISSFITGNLTIDAGMGIRFPAEFEEETPFMLCGGTLTAPAMVNNATVYVGDALKSGAVLMYDADTKTVSYKIPTVKPIDLSDMDTVTIQDIINKVDDPDWTNEVDLTLKAGATLKIDDTIIPYLIIKTISTGGVTLDVTNAANLAKFDFAAITGDITITTATSLDFDAGSHNLIYNYTGSGEISPTITAGSFELTNGALCGDAISVSNKLTLDEGTKMRLLVSSNNMVPGAAAIAGAGELIFDGNATISAMPGDISSKLGSDWTGIVTLANFGANNKRQTYTQYYGPRLKFNGIDGYINGFGGSTFNTELILEDYVKTDGSVQVAWNQNNGGSGSIVVFDKLSGSGTLQGTSSAAQWFRFVDGSEFTGSFNIGHRSDDKDTTIVFGDTQVSDLAYKGRIIIQANKSVVVAEGKSWQTVNQIDVNGTIGGAGILGNNTTFGDGATIDCTKGTLSLASGKTATFGSTLNVTLPQGATADGYKILTLSGAALTYVNCTATVGGVNTYILEQKVDGIYLVEVGEDGIVINVADGEEVSKTLVDGYNYKKTGNGTLIATGITTGTIKVLAGSVRLPSAFMGTVLIPENATLVGEAGYMPINGTLDSDSAGTIKLPENYEIGAIIKVDFTDIEDMPITIVDSDGETIDTGRLEVVEGMLMIKTSEISTEFDVDMAINSNDNYTFVEGGSIKFTNPEASLTTTGNIVIKENTLPITFNYVEECANKVFTLITAAAFVDESGNQVTIEKLSYSGEFYKLFTGTPELVENENGTWSFKVTVGTETYTQAVDDLLKGDNLLLRFDASRGVTTDENGKVTAWTDLKGNKTAATYGSFTSPDFKQGKFREYVDFGTTGSGKDMSWERTIGIKTLIIAMDIDDNWRAFILGDTAAGSFHRKYNNPNIGAYAHDGEVSAYNIVRDNGTVVNDFYNTKMPTGFRVTSIVMKDDASICAARFTQDRDQGKSDSRTGGKRLSEVLLFDKVLTAEELTAVENYLIKKWNLDAVTTHGLWDGEGDGKSWADGDNWDDGLVPGNSDTVTIAGDTEPVIDIDGTVQVSIVQNSTFTINSGTLKIADATKIVDSTITLGESGGLENYGWPVLTGTVTINTDYEKSILSNPGNNPSRIEGAPTFVKGGTGTLTLMSATGGNTNPAFTALTVNNGKLILGCTDSGYVNATSDLKLHGAGAIEIIADKTFKVTGTIDLATNEIDADDGLVGGAGTLQVTETTTYKFPAGFDAGDEFVLTTGTLSAPTTSVKTTITVGGVEKPNVFLTYNAENKSVSYAEAKNLTYEGAVAISKINTDASSLPAIVTLTGDAAVKFDAVPAKAIEIRAGDGVTTLKLVPADGTRFVSLAEIKQLTYTGFSSFKYEWAAGEVISLNFGSNQTDASMSGEGKTDTLAGVQIPDASWINLTGGSGTDKVVDKYYDSVGGETIDISGMTVTYAAGNDGTYAPKEKSQTHLFMNGYLDDGGNTHTSVTLKNVPFETYDAVIYMQGDNKRRAFTPITVTVDDVTKIYTYKNNAIVEGQYVETDVWGDCDHAEVSYEYNTIRITGISGDATIAPITTTEIGSRRTTLAAIQIVNTGNQLRTIWTGAASASGEWDVSSNWDNGVPTANSIAVIPTAAWYAEVEVTANSTAKLLDVQTMGATVSGSGAQFGSLLCDYGLTIKGGETPIVIAGAIAGESQFGQVVDVAEVSIESGTVKFDEVSCSANVYIKGGATLEGSGSINGVTVEKDAILKPDVDGFEITSFWHQDSGKEIKPIKIDGSLIAFEDVESSLTLISLGETAGIINDVTFQYVAEGLAFAKSADNKSITATRMVSITIPNVANTTKVVEVGDEVITPTEEGGTIYLVVPGVDVTITYTAVEGYVPTTPFVKTIKNAQSGSTIDVTDVVVVLAEARVGDTLYATVNAALEALTDNTETTVTILVSQSGKTVTVPANKVVKFVNGDGVTGAVGGATITGAGTIVYDGALPGDEKSYYQASDWTGTVWLKNKEWKSFDFGSLGHAGSKIMLTGITGYGPNHSAGANPEIILKDEENNKALTITDGYSDNGSYFFAKVSGDGTFTTTKASVSATYILKDVSTFIGKIENINSFKIAIGNGSGTNYTSGSIQFINGTTLDGVNGVWTTNAPLVFGNTLTVKLDSAPVDGTPVKFLNGSFTEQIFDTTLTVMVGEQTIGSDFSIKQDANGVWAIVNVAAEWVGGASGAATDWNTPSNWSTGKVPTSSTNVVIPDKEATITLTSASVARTITLSGSATLTMDGVTAANIKNIAVPADATLTINVESGNTATTDIISGAGKLVKTGAGELVLMANSTYTGGTEIVAGTLKFGGASSAESKGPIGTYVNNTSNWNVSVVVKSGATLDINGMADMTYVVELEENAIFKNGSTSDVGSGSRQTKMIKLSGDATVNANGMFGIHNGNHNQTKLDLGSYTLTKVGSGKFEIVKLTVTGDGTFEIAEGTLLLNNGESDFGDATLKMDSGTTLTLNSALTTKNAEFDDMTINGDQVLKVTGKLSGSANLAKLSLGDGATIPVTSEIAVSNALALDDTINIDLGSIGSGNFRIITAPTGYEWDTSKVTLVGSDTTDWNVSAQDTTLVVSKLPLDAKIGQVDGYNFGEKVIEVDVTAIDPTLKGTQIKIVTTDKSSPQVVKETLFPIDGKKGKYQVVIGGLTAGETYNFNVTFVDGNETQIPDSQYANLENVAVGTVISGVEKFSASAITGESVVAGGAWGGDMTIENNAYVISDDAASVFEVESTTAPTGNYTIEYDLAFEEGCSPELTAETDAPIAGITIGAGDEEGTFNWYRSDSTIGWSKLDQPVTHDHYIIRMAFTDTTVTYSVKEVVDDESADFETLTQNGVSAFARGGAEAAAIKSVNFQGASSLAKFGAKTDDVIDTTIANDNITTADEIVDALKNGTTVTLKTNVSIDTSKLAAGTYTITTGGFNLRWSDGAKDRIITYTGSTLTIGADDVKPANGYTSFENYVLRLDPTKTPEELKLSGVAPADNGKQNTLTVEIMKVTIDDKTTTEEPLDPRPGYTVNYIATQVKDGVETDKLNKVISNTPQIDLPLPDEGEVQYTIKIEVIKE